jgi:precorrin-2 dehydrogenase/sirohydrochlorin ferrochelatase
MPFMYPVILDLIEKECLVIGGGTVAERKVLSLLDCGALVTLVSPVVTPKLQELILSNAIKYKEKCYMREDLKDKTLVICATDNKAINLQAAQDCRSMGIWINVVDHPELCSFHVPAVIRRGLLTFSVSTTGASPMLASKIKRKIERDFGPEYEMLLQIMQEVRREARQKIADPKKRYQLYSKILNSNIEQLISEGKTEEIKELIAGCISLQLD